ncbi:EAL domain-containing protein [Thioflavicoccus mobilis 8321]|uniref:EAL domain-containing protein n=1 Tax=Thioflavicoccus mobilis 8321 TaxID=765912 RepID=L0GYF6_9GAMM|nr:EAL domain-containing protein [Thioflavicoccus mobilis]AGA90971.1 EAL domain-containing protein [Thioflavicoccus mobilis 8321]
MPTQSPTVNLLILTSSSNEAREIIQSLRSGGLPARGIYTEQYERLAALTEAQVTVDLILCCLNDPQIELDHVMEHYQEIEADVPLILLTDRNQGSNHLLRALRAGARDLVGRDEIERLRLVVTREFADRRTRCELAETRAQAQRCVGRIRALAEASEEAIAYVREDGMHDFANAAYRRRFGLHPSDELQNLPLLDLVVAKHHQALNDLLKELREAKEAPPLTRKLHVTALGGSGRLFPATLVIAREADDTAALRLIVRDTRHEIAQQAETLVAVDAGFASRNAFVNAVSQRLARAASGEPAQFALIYVGINGFAEILQAVGVTRGLEIATELGAALGRIAPDNCLLTRFADDGFMLILDTDEPADARRLAVAVRAELRLPVTLPTRDTAQPDCVTGFVFVQRTDASFAELVDRAYADAFARKPSIDGERDDTRPATTESTDGHQPLTDAADREIGEMIDEALQKDGLILVYQPIVSLLGDNQENYSVFLRLLDEQQRLHEARELIGPAVRTRSIEAIDHWVVERAIDEMVEQRKQGQKVNFFINMAEETFQDNALLFWLCDQLREKEARGNWLTFQFQEVHARHHLAKLAKLVTGLKKIKARIAIGRFGHDPRPESLLQTLQADFVLFSPDFAQQLSNDPAKQQRLMALANLAREFNAKTVVTGVEDATTLTVLWGGGVDYVQGNFLQRPSTALGLSQD